MTKTKLKGQCHICGEWFDVIEEHHVIPQSCGGRDGPTVNLCGAHHSLIHATADEICREYRAGKRNLNIEGFMWTGRDRQYWPRGVRLVKAIAEAQIRPHDNSVHQFRMDMSKGDKAMLKELQRVSGLSSQEKVVRSALVMMARHYNVRIKP